MDDVTRDRLLTLNRQFYAAVAHPFDATRQAPTPGKAQLVAQLTAQRRATPLRVLDAGCGNGRLAVMLEGAGRAVEYTGVDGEAQLLAAAARNTAELTHVRTRFVQADLAEPDWRAALTEDDFDAVVCLATLQHMPGYALRRRVVSDLAGLTGPDGIVALSGWQFMDSPRLRGRLLDWSTAGVAPSAVEPGDALLPWKQAVYAVRYVHLIDADEFQRLATQAGLETLTTFRADGREGNLNLYVLLQRRAGTRGRAAR